MVVIGLFMSIVGIVGYALGMTFRYDKLIRNERSTLPRITLAVLVFGVGVWLAVAPIWFPIATSVMMLGTMLLMERLTRADLRRKERARQAREAAADSELLQMSSERHDPISDEELARRIGDVDWGVRSWWLTRGGRR